MRPEIHIFSGLGSSLFQSLRRGTDQLEHLIDQMPGNADAKTHIWNDWRRVADDITSHHRKDGSTPVILIGHSNGVFASTKIAEVLAGRGIHVRYIAAIDPTLKWFPKVGYNVMQVDEFHASRGFVAIGRKLSRGRKATIHGDKEFQGVHHVFKHRASHVGVAGLAAVHNVIGSKVRTILK